MPFIPHTVQDTQDMLDTIGVKSIDTLFDEIPASLFYSGFEQIPAGISEMQLLRESMQLAETNKNGICFLGAGAYEHHIPAAVWDIASRGEFLTAYTPYQAEASQGTLQLLYEFQSMICELTGMDVANASMYDGASALAEAVLMAVRLNKKNNSRKVLVSASIHPLYLQTLKTILSAQNIDIHTIAFETKSGLSSIDALAHLNTQDFCALIIAQPNFFGTLEPVDELSDWAASNTLISIACVNPVSLAILKPPGNWGQKGVDIVCGEGQPLGCPMASGGPYFGFLSCKQTHVRQMPGRIIGATVDKDGKQGFTLTLQAREQHIRRAKATSNICTNQGLLVTAATIHMSLLGAEGLQHVAHHCHHNTHYLTDLLTQIKGVELVFDSPYFHEALLRLSKPVPEVLNQLLNAGINGGFAVEPYFPELKNTLLVCATEMRTDSDIHYYADTLKAIMK